MVKCIKLETWWIPSEPLVQVSLAVSEVYKAWEEQLEKEKREHKDLV